MQNFAGQKEFYKKALVVKSVFWGVTSLMLATRYFSFYTYSGADDLHYAFLSHQFLLGNFDMFVADDIYSARALVVLYQAVWFKIFGINDFSTCMPSLSLLVIVAYFVCFKVGLAKNFFSVLLAASLIYFNPVVVKATLGNLPDVYIALITVFVFYLIKKNGNSQLIKQNIMYGIVTGLLLFAGLFVKESIVLVGVGAAVIIIWYRKDVAASFIISLLVCLLISAVGYLCFYYYHTGDFFFHLRQIENSKYFNHCSYDCLPVSKLIKRLTVTVPFVAVTAGAYPFLLLAAALFAFRRSAVVDIKFWKMALLVLLTLTLYFPFSIAPYVPLCHDMRQFFFLFPFATILFVMLITEAEKSKKDIRSVNIAASIVFLIVTTICLVYSPFNKWAIFCNGLLAVFFLANSLMHIKMQTKLIYLIVPVVLWLSTAYPIFKKPHIGYSELKTMQGKLKERTEPISNSFYFLNNDTKTHFSLINQFDTTNQFINLDTLQIGFKPFIGYQLRRAKDNPFQFTAGWLVVSGSYYENMDGNKMNAISSMLKDINAQVKVDNSTGYFIQSKAIIERIMDILNKPEDLKGCY